eukprot:TRINITY_DN4428_c0_g2_i1.p1 TRINITY_DN4428_c0_g2~~TRINITY_DN4428_c0_g2_i1.p1  ORF type:complete len:586 (+),score=141.14 TRINITY_DN4428_c0_g2_i1:46-1758(+)
MKYVLVAGGVLSGIGKGVIASSTARLFKSLGLKVTSIKIDPYLNCDAGLMSPYEHGEVFVLDDGGEADLDLGNYERFVGITLTSAHNITTGKIYRHVIERERRGEYLGKTVQVVPHISDAIQEWIEDVGGIVVDGSSERPDVCVIELGGTVGDIESAPFIEAMRQFQFRVGKDDFATILVSLVPVLGVVGEQKTKPTQHSVSTLRSLGLAPDLIVCRSTDPLTDGTRAKIGQFCHLAPDNILGCHDVSNIYRVPLMLNDQKICQLLMNTLNITPPPSAVGDGLDSWRSMADRVDQLQNPSNSRVHIAMVGKYTGLQDSYLSVIKALHHASLEVGLPLVIDWINAEYLEDSSEKSADEKREYENAWTLLKNAHGILVPGGFGDRGTEGKIKAAQYARVNDVPYFGICLGMQLAVIEFARNVVGLTGANSTEFEEDTKHPVVLFMPEISKTHMGGTMRLGARRTRLRASGSKTMDLYGGVNVIDERHRHRYEVNPEYVARIEKEGLEFVGQDESGKRMEVVEISSLRFFVAVQFHPEFKSRPDGASPIFVGFFKAAAASLTSAASSSTPKEE